MIARRKLASFGLLVATGLVVAATGTPALGAPAPVGSRQTHQQARIAQGVRSGELTRSEVARLEREQRAIEGLRRASWSDGHLSAGERLRLDAAQDRASRHIASQKHDAQER